MGGIHPESRTPAGQVQVGFGALLRRIRALEARPTSLPLIPMPPPASTTSATPAGMISWLSVADSSWTVRLQLLAQVTGGGAAGVLLLDAQGRRLDSADVGDGDTAVLTATGAEGPYTIAGYTSAGTLTITVRSAEVSPWISAADG